MVCALAVHFPPARRHSALASHSGRRPAKFQQRRPSYSQLVDNQIAPHIGAKLLQKLKAQDVESWHTTLKTKGRKDGKGGISNRTIGHAHRVLSKALKEAARYDLVVKNVASEERAPKVDDDEMMILTEDQVNDLPSKMIEVREALEETRKHGVRFKKTKTKGGLRDITLPDIVVDTLREHRRRQLEHRMALGLGELSDDDLVFPRYDDEGAPQAPNASAPSGGTWLTA
jgi:hypothetical protein